MDDKKKVKQFPYFAPNRFGDIVFCRGKHAGQDARKYYHYVKWMYLNIEDLCDDDMIICRTILRLDR